jgi:hypothetical protein
MLSSLISHRRLSAISTLFGSCRANVRLPLRFAATVVGIEHTAKSPGLRTLWCSFRRRKKGIPLKRMSKRAARPSNHKDKPLSATPYWQSSETDLINIIQIDAACANRWLVFRNDSESRVKDLPLYFEFHTRNCNLLWHSIVLK